jgi:hypothetical protein
VAVHVAGTDPVETVWIELLSESDVFCLFEAEYNEQAYEELRAARDLTIEFARFPGALSDIFSAATPREGEFRLRFAGGAEPLLTAQQGLKFKTGTVFLLRFTRPSDDAVKDRIEARDDHVRAQLASVRENLTGVYAMLKIKTPSVLKRLKTPRKSVADLTFTLVGQRSGTIRGRCASLSLDFGCTLTSCHIKPGWSSRLATASTLAGHQKREPRGSPGEFRFL